MPVVSALPNGIRYVVEERPGSGLVSMQVLISTAAIPEAADAQGLTNLMQEAAFGGTLAATRHAIADGIEVKGGSIGGSTGRRTVNFSASVLASEKDAGFATLADVVRRPAFPESEVRQSAMQAAQEITERDERPASRAGNKLFEAVFGDHALGRDMLGTKDLVASFTPAQVKERHAQLIADPARLVVSLAGDLTAAEAERLVTAQFGDMPAASPSSLPAPAAFVGGDLRESTDNDQLNFNLAFEAAPENSRDSEAFLLFGEMLSGGMASPLFQEVREKRSLVYGISAGYMAFETAGLFKIGAGATKGKAGEVVSVTLDLLGKAAKDGFTPEAFTVARERLLRSHAESLETAGHVMSSNGMDLMVRGRVMPAEEFEARLNRVTNDDIRRICATMLKDGKYALAAVGPLDSLQPPAEIKALMQAQAAGIDIPAPPQDAAALSGIFAAAADKKLPAEVTPQVTVLPNGATVMTVERPGNLSCGGWVGVGSDDESVKLNGATHMNEHMMFRGTSAFKHGEIDVIIEKEMGGALNAYTAQDRTAYYFFKLKPEALAKVVHIATDMIFRARLDSLHFEGVPGTDADGKPVRRASERDVVIEEVNMYNDNLGNRAAVAAEAVAYPDQPHGRPIVGTAAGLRALTAQDLRDYRDEYYAPNNVVFCAVGPVKHADHVKYVNLLCGHLPARNFPAAAVPVYKGGYAAVEDDKAQLCKLTLMAEGTSSSDRRSAAYVALGIILGQGSSARLTREAVDKLNLCGGIGAGHDSSRTAGAFVIGAGVEAKNLKPLTATVYKVLRETSENVTQTEVDKAKACMEIGLLHAGETNRGLCDTYARTHQDYGRPLTMADLAAEIRALTLDEVRAAAKAVLASNPTFSVFVPKGTDPALIPAQAEVLAFRDGVTIGAPAPGPKTP